MNYDQNEIVIVAAKRTPIGDLLGSLSTLSAPELGAVAHRAVISETGINPVEIDEVITGCVLSAGLGQAPARQAAIYAEIPESTSATTINKMCGSGMKAVMLAHDLIKAGTANLILAGGMESMSNAPYLLSKARKGYRLGHGEIKDHLFLDGLEDPYHRNKLMGCFAESTASYFEFNRAQQDEYAIRSLTRALEAQANNAFLEEIAPISLVQRGEEKFITVDESPDKNKIAKVSKLRPAFIDNGTVTAANSSSISDGAASLLITSSHYARRRELKPIAKIIAHTTHAQEPAWFTTAPVEAIQKLLKKTGWHSNDVDLFEINEAFAVVAMTAIKQLELKETRVNIYGGACALGHPIGASGARIIVTLIHALKQKGKRRGIAAICIGGGEATAIAIELM